MSTINTRVQGIINDCGFKLYSIGGSYRSSISSTSASHGSVVNSFDLPGTLGLHNLHSVLIKMKQKGNLDPAHVRAMKNGH